MTVMLNEPNRKAAQVNQDTQADALKALGKPTGEPESEADRLFIQGFHKEQERDFGAALDLYEEAIRSDPDHMPSMFRAGILNDRMGDEWRAIELFEHCIEHEETPVAALLNLAVLYEDEGRYQNAASCIEAVLKRFPDHVRARKLKQSVESSSTMVMDDRSVRDRDPRHVVLDTPISEFELSVRSRNCLRQLNIRTVNDLLNKTESELLSNKNFGETSLREIKQVLAARGMKIGQALPQAEEAEEDETVDAPKVATLRRESHDGDLESRSVAELELSVRSRKCLQRLGVTTLSELVNRSENELMSTKNFGQTSLNEIKRELSARGLSLRP